jgi:hypothetical protein
VGCAEATWTCTCPIPSQCPRATSAATTGEATASAQGAVTLATVPPSLLLWPLVRTPTLLLEPWMAADVVPTYMGGSSPTGSVAAPPAVDSSLSSSAARRFVAASTAQLKSKWDGCLHSTAFLSLSLVPASRERCNRLGSISAGLALAKQSPQHAVMCARLMPAVGLLPLHESGAGTKRPS